MKADFNRESLIDALEHAVAVCPTRTPKEILQGCLLAKRDGSTFVCATDQEIRIRANIEKVDCLGGFEAILPATQLLRVVREGRSEVLTVEFGDDRAEICSDHSRFTMPYHGNVPDFPFQGEVAAEGDRVDLVCGVVRGAMDFLAKATDDNNTRYTAAAFIAFDFSEKTLEVCGFDGHIFGKTTIHVPCGFTGRKLLIPKVSRALSLFPDDGTLETTVGESTVCFAGEQGVVYSRLGDGKFPEWRGFIGQAKEACRIEFTINCDALAAVMRQAALCTSFDSCWCDLFLSDGTLTLKAKSADHGTVEAMVPVACDEKYTGSVRPDQVLPFLRHIKKEDLVSWRLGDETHNIFSIGSDRMFLSTESHRDK